MSEPVFMTCHGAESTKTRAALGFVWVLEPKVVVPVSVFAVSDDVVRWSDLEIVAD
jgi:hypothetical protein